MTARAPCYAASRHGYSSMTYPFAGELEKILPWSTCTRVATRRVLWTAAAAAAQASSTFAPDWALERSSVSCRAGGGVSSLLKRRTQKNKKERRHSACCNTGTKKHDGTRIRANICRSNICRANVFRSNICRSNILQQGGKVVPTTSTGACKDKDGPRLQFFLFCAVGG